MNRSTANWIMSTTQCRHCYKRVNPSEVGSDFLCRSCHQLAELFPAAETNRRRRGYTFLPASTLRSIPALYATETTPCAEKTLYLHYFFGSHDWYIAELDPETGRAFVFSPGWGGEWGYADLVEMERTVGGYSVIERGLHFEPTTAGELADR